MPPSYAVGYDERQGAHNLLNHFDGKRFYNPDGRKPRGFLDVLRWKLASHREPAPELIDDVEPSIPPRHVDGPQWRVTLVNHSTVLLQQQNCNLLTDPFWSERASPLSWIGPCRHRPPGVRFEDLPPIQIVLLSHDHYDHLDLATLRRLTSQHRPYFVVPLRVSRLLQSHSILPVHELDWGESITIRGMTIHCVPAEHFSGRGLFDRNKTLWCGYVIESDGGPIYFAGDTAFADHFAAIREQFGNPRLALLPIGAYEPSWIMSPVHMNPAEALWAHRTIGAKTSVAIHHGTLQLGDEGIDAPRKVLQSLLARDPTGQPFLILRNGEHALIE